MSPQPIPEPSSGLTSQYRPGLTPPTVLIVEDNKSTRIALVKLLTIKRVPVLEADSLAQALHLIQTANVNCVVLDLMLPDGNGIKVLQYIRKEALPIRIVVTTGMHVGELNNVKRLHPDSLMLKPCDFDKLLEFIVEL